MLGNMLVGKEVSQVMELMKSFCDQRDSNVYDIANNSDDDLDQKVGINCKAENMTVSPDMNSFNSITKVEHELSDAGPVIKEEPECDEVKPAKRRPGGKKGVSIMGCMDKKTLPKAAILGPCKCPICKTQFNVTDLETEKLYRRHLYSHNCRRFGCQCDKTWHSVKDLKMHIYSCHRGNFHCDVCKQTFQTEDKYEEHVVSDPHKEEPLMCDDCGFTTTSKTTFYSHIKFHHDKNIQVCELCSKEFNGTLKLKLHIRRSHAEKKPCPMCGEMIKSMWLHMKTMHAKDSDKKYQCDECGKGFVQISKLEGHKMSVHIKARPFVCRFGCGAATNDKGNRKKHEITKHGKVFEEAEGAGLEEKWTHNDHMVFDGDW